MSKRRKIALGAVLSVLILVVAGVAIASSSDRGTEVRTEETVRRDLVSLVTASGYREPKRKVDISADISGQSQAQASVAEAQQEAARFGIAQAEAALSEAIEALRHE